MASVVEKMKSSNRARLESISTNYTHKDDHQPRKPMSIKKKYKAPTIILKIRSPKKFKINRLFMRSEKTPEIEFECPF